MDPGEARPTRARSEERLLALLREKLPELTVPGTRLTIEVLDPRLHDGAHFATMTERAFVCRRGS